MEFFDKIGKKASEAYKVTADKTGKIAKETKMKLKINELKSEINDMYKEIGRKVYEKHVIEDEISIKKDLETECTKIDVLSDEIEELLEQCLSLKDKKQCQNCYKEIDIESNYCPNCGEKQKTQEAEKETENKEKTNDVNNDANEKENNENIDNDNDENDDSNRNTEIQESEQENIENSETTNLEKTVSVESDIDIEENLEDEE